MLDTVFMQVIDMTKAASIVIVFILLVRLLMKKAPKIFSYALWAVVLFRLLCPVSIEAPVSVVPEIEPLAQSYTLADTPISFAGASQAAQKAVGDALNGGLGVQHIYTTAPDDYGGVEVVSSHWWEVWILFGQYVWLAGITAMFIYSAVSYILLRRKLIGTILLRDTVYLADGIGSPFVMGLIRPRIYLPSTLSEQEQGYIILHEQHHIRRGDHIIKALAFVALCIHWFNPLAWVAFVLSSKDMEMSCDEAVLKKLGDGIRADYSASLLSLATGRHIIAGTPLAFGEGNTKSRIKNMLNWKKPALWITVIAAIICGIVIVTCIGNPGKDSSSEDTLSNDATLGDDFSAAGLTGQYASVEDYILKQAEDKTTVSLTLWKTLYSELADEEFEATILDRKFEFLEHYGSLEGLDPNGTLEAWGYDWLIKPDISTIEPESIVLAGGAYIDEDGYICWGDSQIVIALRYSDGSYDILGEEPHGDGGDFFGHHNNTQESLYDWYVKKNKLTLPLYAENWIDLITVPEGGSLGDYPVHRYNGDGWYIYLPVQTWTAPFRNAAGNYEIYSQYDTGSHIIIGKNSANEELTRAHYLELGHKSTETSLVRQHGGETHCVYLYPAEDDGCYVVHTFWYDENITDYPYIAMEPDVMRLIAESFTVDARTAASNTEREIIYQDDEIRISVPEQYADLVKADDIGSDNMFTVSANLYYEPEYTENGHYTPMTNNGWMLTVRTIDANDALHIVGPSTERWANTYLTKDRNFVYQEIRPAEGYYGCSAANLAEFKAVMESIQVEYIRLASFEADILLPAQQLSAEEHEAAVNAIFTNLRTDWWNGSQANSCSYESAAFECLHREENGTIVNLYGYGGYFRWDEQKNCTEHWLSATIVTFDTETQQVLDLWWPGDGAAHESSILKKFPESIASTVAEPDSGRSATIRTRLMEASQAFMVASDPLPTTGTTRRFGVQDLRVEISNVLSAHKTYILAEGIELCEYVVVSCTPESEITVLDAGMSDPTYTEDGKAKPQWGLYYTGETERTRITDETAAVPVTSDLEGIYNLEASLFVIQLNQVD